MNFFHRESDKPVENLFAVPIEARALRRDEATAKERYLFYVIVFADSAAAAANTAKRDLRDEKLEFLSFTGPVLHTTLAAWPAFVDQHFSWIKDALPTQAQLADSPRGLVHYTPRIVRM